MQGISRRRKTSELSTEPLILDHVDDAQLSTNSQCVISDRYEPLHG